MEDSLTQVLRQTPLFARLKPEDLAAVARLFQRRTLGAGEKLTRQAEVGHGAYLVESGQLQAWHISADGVVEQGDALLPGDFFGETSLLLGEPHDATVEATGEATVLSLDRAAFDKLAEDRPSVHRRLQVRADVRRKLRAPHFRWQEPGEKVTLALHKHNAVLIRVLLVPTLLLTAMAVAALYPPIPGPVRISAAILAVLPALAALYLIIDHFNDNYIVTNMRALHEERIFAIREYRTEAPLHMVQDVQQLQMSALSKLFNFGDLIIETAGESGQIIFRQIPDPSEARDAIFAEIERVRSVARIEQRARIQSELRRQFGEHPPDDEQTADQASEEHLERALPVRWAAAVRRAFAFLLPQSRHEEGGTITWRKHWIGGLRSLAVPTFLIALATVVALTIAYLELVELKSILYGYGAVLLVLFPWWFWRLTDWQNDKYQVTATRIIDIERRPFALSEHRREASLSRVQNISLQIPGVMGRTFNYGSVTIETAGQGAFTFDHVRDPRRVQAEIFRRTEAFRQRQRQQDADHLRAELMDWFSVYDRLRRPDGEAADSQQRPEETL